MSFSFLHCSDIHLLSLEGTAPWRFLNKRVTGAVNLIWKRKKGHAGSFFDEIVQKAVELKLDRIVVTGDVTNLALESEFELVKRKFDTAPLPVTVIPGNHDIYTRGSARKKRFETFMGAHMQGETLDDAPFPFVQRYGELSLVGVNTAVPTLPMSAIGEIGPSQLERLRRVLEAEQERGQVRVVLMHHPPGPEVSKAGHELLDLEAFAEVIRDKGCELVLHGHEHIDLEYALEGPQGKVQVHGVASGTSTSQRPGREAAFSIYSFDGGTISRRRWRRDDGRFSELPLSP